MKRITCAVLITMALCGKAWAAGAYKDPQTMPEITACEEEKYQVQDKLLNESYRALLTAIPQSNEPGVAGESPRALLIKAQKKWLAFRDADCQTKLQIYGGGSIRFMTMYVCLRERTEQRIKELQLKEWVQG